jgi:hypothetical protein
MANLRSNATGMSRNDAIAINAKAVMCSPLTGSVENKKGSAPPAIHAVIAKRKGIIYCEVD